MQYRGFESQVISNETASRRFKRWLLLLSLVLAVGYVTARTPRQPVANDACPLYYGARMLLHGQNPYDDDAIKAEVAREPVAACSDKIGMPLRPFLSPPLLSVTLLPIAVLPPSIGLRALNYVNLAALLITAWLLATLGGPAWNFESRVVVALFVLLNPAGTRALAFGQVSIIITLLMVLGLRSWFSKAPYATALAFGLSLAKFTMSLPLVLLFAVRRSHRRAAIFMTAAVVFASILVCLPQGLEQVSHSYNANIALTTQPGGINHFADSPDADHTSLINVQRGAYVLFGRWPTLTKATTVLLWLGLLVAGGVALTTGRGRADPRGADPRPLDLCLVSLLALTLFYHRYYDMAMNSLVFYGLMDYRASHRLGKLGPLWWTAVGFLVVTTFETTMAGWSRPFDWLLTGIGLQPFGCYTSLALVATTALVIALALKNRRLA